MNSCYFLFPSSSSLLIFLLLFFTKIRIYFFPLFLLLLCSAPFSNRFCNVCPIFVAVVQQINAVSLHFLYVVSGYVTDSSQTLRVFVFISFFSSSSLSFVIINYGIFQAYAFCCFEFFALLLFHFLSSDFMNVHIHSVLRRKFSVTTN